MGNFIAGVFDGQKSGVVFFGDGLNLTKPHEGRTERVALTFGIQRQNPGCIIGAVGEAFCVESRRKEIANATNNGILKHLIRDRQQADSNKFYANDLGSQHFLPSLGRIGWHVRHLPFPTALFELPPRADTLGASRIATPAIAPASARALSRATNPPLKKTETSPPASVPGSGNTTRSATLRVAERGRDSETLVRIITLLRWNGEKFLSA